MRLLGDYVDTDRRQFWHDNFFVPEVKVLNQNFPRILNITCWLRGAAAQVALVFDDDKMWHEAIDGPFGIRQQVAEGITSDYIWYEQSLGYNSYVVNALASLFETAGLYGRTDELALEMATVENLMLSTLYLQFPDGRLPNPSDTKGQLTLRTSTLCQALSRVSDDDRDGSGRWSTRLEHAARSARTPAEHKSTSSARKNEQFES